MESEKGDEGDDGGDGRKKRCWGTRAEEMRRYHDEEWGRPTCCRRDIFESMTLQIFQCGLTWKCVFQKRRAFRRAFRDYDLRRIAGFDEKDVEALCADSSIIRNRSKIRAIVNNARVVLSMDEDGGRGAFVRFLWDFLPADRLERLRVDPSPSGTHMRSDFKDSGYASRTRSDGVHPTKTCVALSKALKKKGFKFMGNTVTLSFMQAIGLMNHHERDCFVFQRNEALLSSLRQRNSPRPIPSLSSSSSS